MATPTVTIISVTEPSGRQQNGIVVVDIKDENSVVVRESIGFKHDTTIQELKDMVKSKLDAIKNRKSVADILRARIGIETDIT